MEHHGRYLSALMEGSRRRPAAAGGKQMADAAPPADGTRSADSNTAPSARVF